MKSSRGELNYYSVVKLRNTGNHYVFIADTNQRCNEGRYTLAPVLVKMQIIMLMDTFQFQTIVKQTHLAT